MHLSLGEIKKIYSGDLKPIRVTDFYFSAKSNRINHLICQYGFFPFSREILVSTTLVDINRDLFKGTLFQLSFSRSRLADFREKSAITTFFEEAEQGFHSNFKDGNNYEINLSINSEGKPQQPVAVTPHKKSSSYLSFKGMKDFFVESPDQVFGQFQDLVVDSNDWKIKYLVVDINPGSHKTLKAIPFDKVRSISWVAGILHVDLARQSINDLSPYPGRLFTDSGEKSRQQTGKKVAGDTIIFPGDFY